MEKAGTQEAEKFLHNQIPQKLVKKCDKQLIAEEMVKMKQKE